MRKRIHLALVAGVLLLIHVDTVSAATLHYWQFEDSPGYLVDSAGSGTPTDLAGTTSQSALPAIGRGVQFRGLSDNHAATDIDNGEVLTANLSDSPTGDFTIELFAHFDSDPGNFGSNLAGTGLSENNVEIGWLLQNRDGLLQFIVCEGASCQLRSSGIALTTGTDYYLAASFDLTGGEIVFHAQNLTSAGPLQSVSAAHSMTGYNPIATLAIGSSADGFSLPHDGLLDEVRLSDTVLSADQLLIADWTPVIVPLPATIWLFASAIAGLRLHTRKRAG